MGIILDTSLLIAHERRRFDLSTFLLSHGSESVAIASITLSELLHGWFRASDPVIKAERGRFIEAVRQDYTIVPFASAQAETHAQIWAELERRGSMIGAHDLQIAATALSLEYSLATFNDREFSRISNLHVINPVK